MTLLGAHDHDLADLGPLGWVLVGLAAAAVVWVVWRAVVLTARPGEDDPGHIKHSILDDDAPEKGSGGAPTAPPARGE